MDTYLRPLYRYLLLAPAVLPLFYIDGFMYPMLAPKTLALRALGLVAVALFAYLAASGEPFFWQRLKDWRAWVPAGLLAVAYLTSLSGVDFYRSFWSTFERGDGLLTLTVCVAYFYLLLLSLGETLSQRLLKVIAWVGSIAGAYVILQWVAISSGLDLSPWLAKANGRVGGTMGNAAFLAAYLAMTFFVTLAIARDYTGQWRTALYTGAVLQLIGVFIAATRGSILALFVVGAAALAYEALRGEGVRRTWALRGVAGFAVLVVLFIALRAPLSTVPIEPVRRIASISLDDGTVASRLFLWQNLLPEALKSPVFGVGAEHVSVLFDRVYDPSSLVEEWFDRSHNAYLDYLIQFGVLGLALYLLYLFFALRTSLYVAKRESGPWQRYAMFLSLAFAVYALQNFFVFDTGVTLWLLFALGAVVLAHVVPSTLVSARLFPAAKWVGALGAAFVVVLLVPVVVQPARANLNAFEAYLYHVVDVPRTNAAIERGLSLGTYADLEFGYNAYFMYTNEQHSMLAGEDRVAAHAAALEMLTKNHERYPYDARTTIYLLQILDAAPDGVAVDEKLRNEVIVAAIHQSPKRTAPWYIVANLAIEEQRYAEAVTVLKDYVALVPNLAEPRYVLADLYLAIGEKEKARVEAESGKALYTPHLATAKRAVVYYEKIYDLPNAKFFLRQVLSYEPDNQAALADLAAIEAYEQSL